MRGHWRRCCLHRGVHVVSCGKRIGVSFITFHVVYLWDQWRYKSSLARTFAESALFCNVLQDFFKYYQHVGGCPCDPMHVHIGRWQLITLALLSVYYPKKLFLSSCCAYHTQYCIMWRRCSCSVTISGNCSYEARNDSFEAMIWSVVFANNALNH